MKIKFDPKKFTGKSRIWRPVTGYLGVSRLWCWNASLDRYESPRFGKSYVARRPRSNGRRECRFFKDLPDAWSWLHEMGRATEAVYDLPPSSALTVGDVIENWKQERWCHISLGTRILYENRLSAFGSLLTVPIESLNASTIDAWITGLKCKTWRATRNSFGKELKLMRLIVNWYLSRFDDAKLVSPFKERHKEMVNLRAARNLCPKFMSAQEFEKFLESFETEDRFHRLLAIVQCKQVMRVSEVCAMKFSNLDLHSATYRVREHVVWPRKGGQEPMLRPGTKSDVSEAIIPLRKEVVALLSTIQRTDGCDLVFHQKGSLLTYRQVQHAFDKAFTRAGLPYRGTHVLRHTGATLFLEETGDTLALTQMGNWSNPSMAMHYGKILKDRARKAVQSADDRVNVSGQHVAAKS